MDLRSRGVAMLPWMEFGSCFGTIEPDLWFCDDPGEESFSTELTVLAKSFCADCAVRDECADLGWSEPSGVYGGLGRLDRIAGWDALAPEEDGGVYAYEPIHSGDGTLLDGHVTFTLIKQVGIREAARQLDVSNSTLRRWFSSQGEAA